MAQQLVSSTKTTLKVTLTTLILTTAYAFVRYNVVRKIPLDHFPLFILNKSVALAATILIGVSFVLGPLSRLVPSGFSRSKGAAKNIGIVGFALASFHALTSLALLNPANYPRFYESSGKLNLTGELSIVMGILAFLLFATISVASLPQFNLKPNQWKAIANSGYLAYFFVLLHVFVMGRTGWFRPDSWQYGMASISLIAAVTIVLVFVIRIFAKARR